MHLFCSFYCCKNIWRRNTYDFKIYLNCSSKSDYFQGIHREVTLKINVFKYITSNLSTIFKCKVLSEVMICALAQTLFHFRLARVTAWEMLIKINSLTRHCIMFRGLNISNGIFTNSHVPQKSSTSRFK